MNKLFRDKSNIKEPTKVVQDIVQQTEAPFKHTVALRIAVKLIKMFEGCNLVAYPDPSSDLYKEMSRRNILRKWMSGEITVIPKDMQELSGAPWTAMWGETEGVKCGDVYTQERADEVLEVRAKGFLEATIKACPQLAYEAPERLGACVSLAYNIGSDAFAKSTVCKKTQEKCYTSAGDAFLLWNKAGGVVMDGLVKRRKIERDVFISVSV